MKVRNTLEESNGNYKIVVETVDEKGATVHVGSRGIPAELATDTEYLQAMAIVTAKETTVAQTNNAVVGTVISEIEV